MSIAYDIYRVLLDHCVEPESGQATFIRVFSRLLERTTFKQGLIAHDLWKNLWDKPFFANVKASVANPQVERTRHVFEQLDFIKSDCWEIVGPAVGPDTAYQIHGSDLKAALAGHFASLNGPLNFPCTGFRLFRNRLLALDMPSIAQAHRAIDNWLSAKHAASDALFHRRTVAKDRCLRNAFRQLAEPVVQAIDAVPGFARTTAYHALADVGHPVYKTDTWVRAFVLAQPDVGPPLAGILRRQLRELPRDLLNPEAQYARELMFDRLDTLLDNFQEDLDELGALGTLSVGFQRLRAADFLFAHFGIGAQAGYGLYRTPLEALQDAAIAAQYPALANIAQNIRLFGAGADQANSVANEDAEEVSTPDGFPGLRAAVNDLERTQPAAPRCQSCDSRAAAQGIACNLGF